MKKSTKIGLSAGVGLLLLGAIVSGGGDDSSEAKPNDRAAVQASDSPRPKENTQAKEPAIKTQAEVFIACINKAGTASEKAAAKHITKVKASSDDDLIPMAEIFTDYAGDLISGDAASGKLVASAWGSCHKSDSGSALVTVYNKAGEILSNGNY